MKMKRMATVVISSVLFLAAGWAYAGMNGDHMKDHMGGTHDSANNTEDAKTGGKGAWHIKEAEAGGVTVKVTYKNPGSPKGPRFSVVFDTHTVELDQYKLDEITVLRDASGKSYKPSIVSSSGSGHHREALLEFKDADIAAAKYLDLAIKGVSGVEERAFRFERKR